MVVCKRWNSTPHAFPVNAEYLPSGCLCKTCLNKKSEITDAGVKHIYTGQVDGVINMVEYFPREKYADEHKRGVIN